MTVKKQLLHLVSAAVILMGAMAVSAYAHASHAHVHKSPALTKAAAEMMVLHLSENATIDAKSSVLREKRGTRTEVVRASLAPVIPLNDEAGIEGGGCIRELCACNSATHGNPWCYSTTRGDCPNHQGLLCVWGD